MTDNEQTTAAKKRLDEERAAREKANEAQAKTAAGTKPTPTQAENDLAAMGVHLMEHEHDGSADPNEAQTKQAEAGGRGSYKTRTATPAT
jgi:uncharacterized protein YdaU (DUF1376 family)